MADPRTALIEACRPRVERLARKLAGRAVSANDLAQAAMVEVTARAGADPTLTPDAFITRHFRRIQGAMLDLVRAEVRTARFDQALLAGISPVLQELDEGDLLAPAAERQAHKEHVESALLTAVVMTLASITVPPTPEEALDHALAQHRLSTALQHALGKLPADERTLVKEIFEDELTTEQAAERYGVHKSTISRRVQDTLGRVKKSMLQSWSPSGA